MTLNGVTTADTRYLCGRWASCCIMLYYGRSAHSAENVFVLLRYSCRFRYRPV